MDICLIIFFSSPHVYEQEQTTISQHSLEIVKPDKVKIKYTVKLGDEPILAPMALFRPLAFGLQVRLHGGRIGQILDQFSQTEIFLYMYQLVSRYII